jgi:triphosphatase
MSSSIHSATQKEHGHNNGREVEWQLACTDLGSVRRWLADHVTIDGLVLEPRSTLQIFDTYLDTDDWRIHRAGFALRIRSESGRSEATLKSLHYARAELADRRELSETLENSESESIRQSIGPVGTRVHAVSGARALLPLFEVRTSRQRFAIRREDEAQQLGEIALDETVISHPHGEPQTSLQLVEVEALTEAHEPLQSLVKTLRSDCALEAASDTKYSQGLKSIGLAPGPAPEFASTAVDASMSIAEVALANLRRHLSDWHLHEPGARLGDDPDELHDLRVAARILVNPTEGHGDLELVALSEYALIHELVGDSGRPLGVDRRRENGFAFGKGFFREKRTRHVEFAHRPTAFFAQGPQVSDHLIHLL